MKHALAAIALVLGLVACGDDDGAPMMTPDSSVPADPCLATYCCEALAEYDECLAMSADECNPTVAMSLRDGATAECGGEPSDRCRSICSML